jgi:hypothetical protein
MKKMDFFFLVKELSLHLRVGCFWNKCFSSIMGKKEKKGKKSVGHLKKKKNCLRKDFIS